MVVVVDKNNPLVSEAFQQFGEVRALRTPEITKEAVRDAEILIVRTETKVTKELLDGSAVRFVGTATIGTDHVDTEYLASTGRGFASAPGCNANSVAEYLAAALLLLAEEKNFALKGKTIGVVGVGNVGSKVARNARALGMTVLENDPPLKRKTGAGHFLPLDALMEADIVTLHVPLTKAGCDATYHLFSRERISKMKKGSILVNTSRGPVVDGNALGETLASHHLLGAVLDVWEYEPQIDIGLLEKVDIGTSHIAGYSFDGKLTAVKMLYKEACRFFSQQESWSPDPLVPRSPMENIFTEKTVQTEEKLLRNIVKRCYDIERDDSALRAIGSIPENERGLFFARLRAEYPVRREFFNTTVSGNTERIENVLRVIGFQVNKNTQ